MKKPTAQAKQQYLDVLHKTMTKCFSKEPAGPSRHPKDNLRMGTEWWLTDTLTAYVMEGAHYKFNTVDEQIWLVSFEIGKRKVK